MKVRVGNGDKNLDFNCDVSARERNLSRPGVPMTVEQDHYLQERLGIYSKRWYI